MWLQRSDLVFIMGIDVTSQLLILRVTVLLEKSGLEDLRLLL